MLPVLAHHCVHCQYNTPVPFTASVFSEDHLCHHCGIESQLRVRNGAEQRVADMQQDELASLFSRQLNFSSPTPPPDELLQKQQQVVVEKIHDPQPIVFASTHYTHTHHLIPARYSTPPESQSASSRAQGQEQEQRPQASDAELVQMLVRNWIDPALLSPSQVQLFRNADYDQRLRLLELWRISPPISGAYDPVAVQAASTETDMRQEEYLAKARYEARMQDRQFGFRSGEHMMLEPDAPVISEPPRPSTAPPDGKHVAEPYMVSGYELLASREYDATARAITQPQPLEESTRYNQATDPVYGCANTTGQNAGLWEKVDTVQDMENAYGKFEISRAMELSTPHARNGLDEEMVL